MARGTTHKSEDGDKGNGCLYIVVSCVELDVKKVANIHHVVVIKGLHLELLMDVSPGRARRDYFLIIKLTYPTSPPKSRRRAQKDGEGVISKVSEPHCPLDW